MVSKYNLACSERVEKYFDYLATNTETAFSIATKAREKGYDPDDFVEIKLAKNMAERVVGIISVVAPQIVNSGVVERIIELEKEYASQDWRVAFKIALEVAEQKFCSFESKIEAIEVGVRTGFAYVTVGVVSSPLEGMTTIDIVPRRDGKGEFFRINYAGPIRNAGGTAASVSVLIADYVRKHLGYAKYDPDEREVLRCNAEIEDYQQFVAPRQYSPSEEESEFLMKHIPVEISGDPSERREISNAKLKDLPRIPTNIMRSGYCLMHTDCIPLKAPKLWKQLANWGEEMGMEDWNFLGEYVKLQKELKAKRSGQSEESAKDDAIKVKPDPTFVSDIVGGRPVLGHPMCSGGFRLRYGRGRASGYSAQSIHPATMHVLNNYIATGTQLKVERPGKGAAFTPCDSICGPVVKLDDDSVIYLDTEEEAKRAAPKVKEILYLGDVLVNYGDFFNRAHVLLPPGYCEEWWYLELEEVLKENKKTIESITYLSTETKKQLQKNPITAKPTFNESHALSKEFHIPLHPSHTYFYKEITTSDLISFLTWLNDTTTVISEDTIVLQHTQVHRKGKRTLELLGIPHSVSNNIVTLWDDKAKAILHALQISSKEEVRSLLSELSTSNEEPLTVINKKSDVIIKDKSGFFIGSRMGRPEKAKMRKLTGSPHGLFPIGEEGGRLRSFQAALEATQVTADLPVNKCPSCKNQTPLRVCEVCDTKTVAYKINPKTGESVDPTKMSEEDQQQLLDYKRNSTLYFRPLFDACLKKMGTRIYPDLIKGVRGVMGKERIPEHPIKAVLRAKNEVAVNKDGTVRYDASELTLTHFKPKEVGTSVSKLKELGYTHDINGEPLENEEQVLELFCQDVVLPACPVSPEAGADTVLVNTTKFVDDLLTTLYEEKPFYNIEKSEDLVGHLVIGLAPHTSAGTVGRIVGFSKTQGLFAHPLYHAAMRRDCDGDEACVFLLMDAFLNFSQKYLPSSRGGTMDAPLVLTTILNPSEVDDMAFDVDIVDSYGLEFYKACEAYKYPWDIKIKQINDNLFTENQFENNLFTHDTSDLNGGVLCSDYKLLPSMGEKIHGQMDLAKKIRAVRSKDVAALVVEKHFIRDMKGNLRKFSMQQFRCVSCNEKFRRTPLSGKCTACGGKIVFTISQGSIEKYLKMSIQLAEEFNVNDYLKETIYLTQKRITDYFGKEKEKQVGLGSFIS